LFNNIGTYLLTCYRNQSIILGNKLSCGVGALCPSYNLKFLFEVTTVYLGNVSAKSLNTKLILPNLAKNKIFWTQPKNFIGAEVELERNFTSQLQVYPWFYPKFIWQKQTWVL